MNLSSEALFKRSCQIVPGGVHSPVRSFSGVGGTPLFIQSAKGAYLEEVSGKRYLDFCLSWGPLPFGHQPPELKTHLQAALERGWSSGTTEPYSLALAEWITQTLPWVDKIRFVSSGTEAVMSAVRLARGVTQKNKLLKFEGCYHGHVDSLLVRAGSGLATFGIADSAGIPPSVATETWVCPLDDRRALESLLDTQGNSLAAIIVEGLPANHGLLKQAEDFLKFLSEWTERHQVLFILDEVITGFRFGLQGMAGKAQVVPDLVTYGKILGGGFPAAAYGGKAKWMQAIAPEGPVYQAGTLSAHPIAMQAGLWTLQKLQAENPYPVLEQTTQRLAKNLETIAKHLGVSLTVPTEASLFWICFGTETPPRAPGQIPPFQKQLYPKLFHECLNRGVYLPPSPYEVCFLSTAHTQADLEFFEDVFEKALMQVL